MSKDSIEVITTKLDILIEDFKAFKKLVYTVIASTALFIATSIVGVSIALIN